jgi:hypothetical protein
MRGLAQRWQRGDFDGDGYADLAVGVPYAEVNGDAEAGAVHVLYGRSTGLAGLGDEVITQDTAGFVQSPAEPNDRFGFSLAAGDFNGDGADDLAVGTPFEDNGVGYEDAGSVQVFYGKSGNTAGNSGLLLLGAVQGAQHWRSDSPNVEGAMEAGTGSAFPLPPPTSMATAMTTLPSAAPRKRTAVVQAPC